MQLVEKYRHSRRDFLRDGRLFAEVYQPKPHKSTSNSNKPSLKKYGDELRQRLTRDKLQKPIKNPSNNSTELLSYLSRELTEKTTYGFSNVSLGEMPIRADEPKYFENVYLDQGTIETIDIETTADGGRLEFFETGGYVFKDVLGKVVEVCSGSGDRLNLEYCSSGILKSFSRTDKDGILHSSGAADKDGVVVRDHEGRAKARGETMTVDTLGRLFIHDINGQYFSIDLLSGSFSERRLVDARIKGIYGGKYITAVFARDGFRMATFFVRYLYNSATGVFNSKATAVTSLRFYGRDGSLVEFASLDDLKEMKPQRVLAANTVLVKPVFRAKKANWTCWQSVNEYLLGVG